VDEVESATPVATMMLWGDVFIHVSTTLFGHDDVEPRVNMEA
jgi:hypothetical protein